MDKGTLIPDFVFLPPTAGELPDTAMQQQEMRLDPMHLRIAHASPHQGPIYTKYTYSTVLVHVQVLHGSRSAVLFLTAEFVAAGHVEYEQSVCS